MSELRGKRALVTGASSGIGAVIAKELAGHGVDLVVSARRRAALDEVARLCGEKGVRVDVVTADLGRADAASALWNAASASGPIDILVNNAGFGCFRPFASTDWERDAEMLQLNISSLVELSYRFVAARRADSSRAYLLNIASIAAYQSVPNFAVYASTKAFVRNFTEALHVEVKGTAVSATCVCPGGTTTDFHASAGAGDYGWIANRSMMSPDAVARVAIRAMRKGKRNVVPGFMNKLSTFGVRLVPRSFASWMAGRLMGKPRAGTLPPRGATRVSS